MALIVGLSASYNATALSNMETLAYPLLALLKPGHDVLWRGGYLLALLAFSGLWASMQRRQIEGGPFMGFAGSLPFTPRQLRHVNIVVLLLADGPLLFLVGAALASTVAHHAPPARPLLLCDLVLMALVTQVAVLEQRLANLPLLALTCFMVAASFDTRAALALELLVGAAAVLALWLVPRQRTQRAAVKLAVPVPIARERRPRSAFVPAHVAALQISFAILHRERRNELIGKALLAAGIVAAAWRLVQLFDGDARGFPTILMAQGVVALTMSGLFRHLHMAHRASTGFTGALPLAPCWWRVFDMTVVAACCLPFLAILAAVAWYTGVATPWQGAAAVISSTFLLCGLALPHWRSERHAVIIGGALTGLWVAAMIAYLT